MAFLLDTSGSMEGLVKQAQGQLWRLVNELAKAEKNGKPAVMEIALISYGNPGNVAMGHCRLLSTLTTDVDLLSDKLFNLEVGGGEEYPGFAIRLALDSLRWSNNKKDLKLIFVAGNEAFDQGETDYLQSCEAALNEGVIINTIYCGATEEGKDLLWADAAEIGEGKYLSIYQDSSMKKAETLWDNRLIDYNEKLNSTYVPYGEDGPTYLNRQEKQDQNALMMGKHFLRERLAFKTSGKYVNPHWDLCDAFKNDSSILTKLSDQDLPEVVRSKNVEERRRYIQIKLLKRQAYVEGARIYYEKARETLASGMSEEDLQSSLEGSIVTTVKEQARERGFLFKEP